MFQLFCNVLIFIEVSLFVLFVFSLSIGRLRFNSLTVSGVQTNTKIACIILFFSLTLFFNMQGMNITAGGIIISKKQWKGVSRLIIWSNVTMQTADKDVLLEKWPPHNPPFEHIYLNKSLRFGHNQLLYKQIRSILHQDNLITILNESSRFPEKIQVILVFIIQKQWKWSVQLLCCTDTCTIVLCIVDMFLEVPLMSVKIWVIKTFKNIQKYSIERLAWQEGK